MCFVIDSKTMFERVFLPEIEKMLKLAVGRLSYGLGLLSLLHSGYSAVERKKCFTKQFLWNILSFKFKFRLGI